MAEHVLDIVSNPGGHELELRVKHKLDKVFGVMAEVKRAARFPTHIKFLDHLTELIIISRLEGGNIVLAKVDSEWYITHSTNLFMQG